MNPSRAVDLTIDLAGVELATPVLNASGTWSLESPRLFEEADPAFLPGALVTKTVTLPAKPGNPTPRTGETQSGMLNAIGLQNRGLEVFLAEELPVWLSFGRPVIVNISGNTVAEYVELAQRLTGTGIVGIEANLSCPNVKHGLVFSTDPKLTLEVVSGLRAATDLPLIIKLTPNVTDVKPIAQAAEKAGANAISLINTIRGMDIDIETGKPVLGNVTGGLSGPAIQPIALAFVYEVCQTVKIPVIGMGGISCWQDAVKSFMAGATAVAVGTANFTNPLVMSEIIEGIRRWFEEKGYGSVREIPRLIIPGREKQK